MKRKIDVVGKKFGSLLVLEEIRVPYSIPSENRKSILKLRCQCECGSIIFPFKGNVLGGKTKSCLRCTDSKNLIGKKIGSVTVLRRDLNEDGVVYVCRCDCGSEILYKIRSLIRSAKVCCEKCRFPKKYSPQIPKKSRRESICQTNYLKHLKAKSDLIGKRIGRLKITGFSHWEQIGSRRRAFYKATCKCGNKITFRACSGVKSCGCLKKESASRGENHVGAKLTNSQADAIREFKKSNIGYTQKQIADMFGVSEDAVSKIIREKTYV